MPTVLRAIRDAGVLNEDCPTISGQTIGEVAAAARAPDNDVVRRGDNPISPNGGVVVLRGSLAPDGALLKVAGLDSPAASFHQGPARGV